MRLDKLTTKSQEALEAAQELAHQHTQQEVDGEHLALALTQQQDGIIPTLLKRIEVDLAKLQADLEGELAQRAKVQGARVLVFLHSQASGGTGSDESCWLWMDQRCE